MGITSIRNQLLFHGTCEDIEGPLMGGGYDKILWTAEDPAIAQSYIPESGITTYQCISQYNLDAIARPEQGIYEIAKQMGYTADIGKDQHGQVNSFRWFPQKLTVKEIDQYLRSLGYTPNGDMYNLKSSLNDGKWTFFPADYKMPGTLYIIFGREKLKIYDYAEPEGSLLDLQYHHHNTFKTAIEAGYDAIRINDFAQTQKYGNLGHISIGLFPSGLAKVQHVCIPATNHNWDNDTDTQEFLEWAKNQSIIA